MADKTDTSAGTAPAPGDSSFLDTSSYKAMAHPDRLRMLGMLRFDGPATATGLAKRLGLNSGATSYHLRQLAQHGLIEEATSLGNKRDRWWQARRIAAEKDPAEAGGAPAAVIDMVRGIFRQHQEMMQRGICAFAALPDAWKKTANISDYTMALTAAEAEALKERLLALLWEEVRKAPAQAGKAPGPGKRNYTIMLHAFPFAGGEDDGSETPKGA
ncbi:MAG: helix-turn-helix domain-containing protein [Alphaproteobacteria bacterium]|nr:helix-turn-helix domain-containing protein [Alphaproteobacteria bacterium]